MCIRDSLLASEARVDGQHIRTGQLKPDDWQKLGVAVSRLDSAPIFIDDNPNVTVMDIRARARRLRKSEGDLGVVMVDYLQLMTCLLYTSPFRPTDGSFAGSAQPTHQQWRVRTQANGRASRCPVRPLRRCVRRPSARRCPVRGHPPLGRR